MKKNRNISAAKHGFTLAEVLAAMIIGSMVLIAVLTVYSRAERTAADVTRSLSNSRRHYEALQLIAEDLDKLISTDSDTNVTITNRYINNYPSAVLLMERRYKDAANREQQYERIIWQCNTNYELDANDLVLYRYYEGIAPEDKLLDKNKEPSEKNVYVPVCSGITYFGIDVLTSKEEPDKTWSSGIPLGITLTISFARPYKDLDGYYQVPEETKYSRTIALDKSRNIKFKIQENNPPERGIETTQISGSDTANPSDNRINLTRK